MVNLHGGVSLGTVGERTSQSLQLPLLFFFSVSLLEYSALKALLTFAGLLFFTEVEKDWKFFFPHCPLPSPGSETLFGPGILAFPFPALQNRIES